MRRVMKRKHLLVVIGALVAVGGLAHWRKNASKCPFEHTASASELEEIRLTQAARLRQGEKAKTRPASGLVLGSTTKTELRTWATAASLTCGDEMNGAAVRCVAPEGDGENEGALSDVFARFDPKGALVALDIVHKGMTPERAATELTSLAHTIESAVGPSTSKRGEPTAENLGGGALSHAAFEFRFADYAADVSATSFAGNGIVVREQYRAL
jgi:hypothetical protein